jgi:hypothetical protein
MASTIVRLLPTIGAATFSLLAFVFSLLTVTSKKWAVRHNYDPVLNPADWRDPIYTLYRSPFTVCSAALVNASAAGSSGLTASDFDVNCTRFRPRGFNKTSCELAIATQDDTAITIGDNRLCQQIHYAGNYWIASTAFIGLAFLLTVVLAIFTFIKRPKFATEGTQVAAKGIQSQSQNDGQQYGQGNGGPSTTPVVVGGRQQGTVWVTWVAFVLLVFMFVGFATAIIGQYYGVTGLIQSLPNNADFASSSAGSRDDVNTQGSHGPWFQGVGLSVYATCSWGFAIAAGVIASRAWPLPQWEVAL